MITLRWEEYSFYDVMTDREMLRLEAITDRGTFHCDVEDNVGVRERRKAFKESVLERLADGDTPHRII